MGGIVSFNKTAPVAERPVRADKVKAALGKEKRRAAQAAERGRYLDRKSIEQFIINNPHDIAPNLTNTNSTIVIQPKRDHQFYISHKYCSNHVHYYLFYFRIRGMLQSIKENLME